MLRFDATKNITWRWRRTSNPDRHLLEIWMLDKRVQISLHWRSSRDGERLYTMAIEDATGMGSLAWLCARLREEYAQMLSKRFAGIEEAA